MTWLNINPRLEPYSRLNAAKILAADPKNRGDVFVTCKNDISSTEVARLYNNAENLGLDLLSLGVIPFDYIDDEE